MPAISASSAEHSAVVADYAIFPSENPTEGELADWHRVVEPKLRADNLLIFTQSVVVKTAEYADKQPLPMPTGDPAAPANAAAAARIAVANAGIVNDNAARDLRWREHLREQHDRIAGKISEMLLQNLEFL